MSWYRKNGQRCRMSVLHHTLVRELHMAGEDIICPLSIRQIRTLIKKKQHVMVSNKWAEMYDVSPTPSELGYI